MRLSITKPKNQLAAWLNSYHTDMQSSWVRFLRNKKNSTPLISYITSHRALKASFYEYTFMSGRGLDRSPLRWSSAGWCIIGRIFFKFLLLLGNILCFEIFTNIRNIEYKFRFIIEQQLLSRLVKKEKVKF